MIDWNGKDGRAYAYRRISEKCVIKHVCKREGMNFICSMLLCDDNDDDDDDDKNIMLYYCVEEQLLGLCTANSFRQAIAAVCEWDLTFLGLCPWNVLSSGIWLRRYRQCVGTLVLHFQLHVVISKKIIFMLQLNYLHQWRNRMAVMHIHMRIMSHCVAYLGVKWLTFTTLYSIIDFHKSTEFLDQSNECCLRQKASSASQHVFFCTKM